MTAADARAPTPGGTLDAPLAISVPGRQSGRDRRAVTTIVRVLVTLALLAFLASRIDGDAVMRSLATANLWLLAAALVVAVVDRIVMALKWYPLLRVQTPNVGLGQVVRVYFVSSLASLVLPATVGGDVVRALAVARSTAGGINVAMSIVVERLLGAAAAAVWGLVAISVALRLEAPMEFLLPWGLAAVIASLGMVVLPFLIPISHRTAVHSSTWSARLRRKVVDPAISSYGLYRSQARMLFWVWIATLVEQALPIVISLLIGWALGLQVPLAHLVIAVPLAMFIGRLPISLNGIGVTESALAFVLGLFGAPIEHGVLIWMVGRAVGLVASLPGALFWHEFALAKASTAKPTAA